MSVVYSSDLSQAMSSSAAINSLNADKEDTASMINALQDFISNTSGRLVGDGYDRVRSHLQGYIKILESRMKIADDLISGIKSACGTMISYMDGEAKLDTSELDFYNTKLINLTNRLESIVASIMSYDPDESDVSLASLRSAYYACENEIKEVKRMIDLLENLDAADAGAYASYLSSDQGVSSLASSVASIPTINI